MTDNEVVEHARHLYRQLQIVPRWHHDNNTLLRAWSAVCGEMGRRGITDTVTEGETTADRFRQLMDDK